MLLGSSISMLRKALALAVVVIVSSFAPATAVAGFCAKMPCCFGEVHDGPVFAANRADCCTTISCYEAPSHELTVSTEVKIAPAAAPALLPLGMAVPGVHVVAYTFDDSSPPPTTKQRLTSLSTLLI